MCELVLATIWDSESPYWGCPEHILRPMNWHEMACFQELLKRHLQKLASSGPKFDFQKVLSNASIVSKMTSNHFWGVAVRFRINFIPLERFWSDFKRNEKIEFSKNFWLDFKHISCINPYQNSNIFYFLNFFSKMKPLIENAKRWSF